MPGAPNRPPEPAAPSAPPPTDPLERRVLRRLAPGRVALRLDIWKGAPSRELVDPLAKAEELYRSGDARGADSALDQLAVRLAEPRWPTIPLPFRHLRVAIPAPQPPHYDPEHAIPPAEREARRVRREAETQLALAKASVDWAAGHSVEAADLRTGVGSAETALGPSGVSEAFWKEIDGVWERIRERVPMPTAPGRPSPAPPPAAANEAAGAT